MNNFLRIVLFILAVSCLWVGVKMSEIKRKTENQIDTITTYLNTRSYDYQVNIDMDGYHIFSNDQWIGSIPFGNCAVADSIFIADNQ